MTSCNRYDAESVMVMKLVMAVMAMMMLLMMMVSFASDGCGSGGVRHAGENKSRKRSIRNCEV